MISGKTDVTVLRYIVNTTVCREPRHRVLSTSVTRNTFCYILFIFLLSAIERRFDVFGCYTRLVSGCNKHNMRVIM